jgi:5-formyltetrahydrofolate cyclo-ligase
VSKKEIFRQKSSKKLALAKSRKITKDYKVLSRLLKSLRGIKNKTILLYMPLENEVDIKKIFRHLRQHNRILLPFMEGVSFKVVKLRLPMHEKKYSILEPYNSWAFYPKIDIAIVPVIGVDGALRRIGFGKGMYDRFFSSLKYKPYVIFVQRDRCFTNSQIGNSFDLQADEYITPNDFIKRRGKDGIRTFYSRRGSPNRRCSKLSCC